MMKKNDARAQWQAQKRRCVEALLSNEDKTKQPFLKAVLALCLQNLRS